MALLRAVIGGPALVAVQIYLDGVASLCAGDGESLPARGFGLSVHL